MAEDRSSSLYNDAIVGMAKLDVATTPLERPDVSIRCDNPLCGDRIVMDANGEHGRITALAHKTRGCLLTRAAASIVARHAPDLEPGELDRVRDELDEILAGRSETASWPELAMFTPVAAVRSRHECVRLPLQALREVLDRLHETRPDEGT